jgi:putative ABC transport system permease protein
MNITYAKNIIRTIKSSLGRYFALICIVMLGVIFYVGLKITTVDMIDTANDFYDKSNFYDYCLVSNLGFDTDVLQKIRNDGKVYYAEGAFYQDYIVILEDDSEKVFRFHSITDNINKLDVVEGRLPVSADECVLDARYYDSDMIGQTIEISDLNSEDNLENLAYQSFTVTGLVNSPLYLSYQRGTTSVGSGSINSFVFVNFEAFSVDYYTQIYLDAENGYYIYSNAYDEMINDRLSDMESICDSLTEERYDKLSAELQDAKNEYETGLSDYNSSYAEYSQNLADYEAGLKDYEAAYSEYESSEAAYESIETQYNNCLDTYNDLAEKDYSASYVEELKSSIAQLQEQMTQMRPVLDATKISLEEVKEGLDSAKEELDSALNELDSAKADLDEAYDEINITIDSPKASVLLRDDNQGYSTYKDNADIVKSIAYIFPLFFALVAALVCITTMNRMVEEERTQIGTLKSLGYSKVSVFVKYIFYSLSASVIGGVAGFYIGSALFPTVIWKAYMLMYTYTDHLNLLHDYSLLALSLTAVIILLVGSTILTCSVAVAEKPAELVRPKSPTAGKKILLERISFLWNRFSFRLKISLRNCFRYKKRFFMMLIGIAGCTALLIIGFGIRDSISSVCDLQYGEIDIYDYLITFKDDISTEEINSSLGEIKNISSEILSVSRSTGDISFANVQKSATITVSSNYDELDKFVRLHNDDMICRPASADECVISKNLADALDVKAGEMITLTFDNYSEGTYTISGIYDNYVNNYIYLTEEGYIKGYGQAPKYNCVFANKSEQADLYETLTRFSEVENVSNVSATQVTLDYFNDMVKSLNVIVYLVIGCAAVLAFVVLYNLNNINIMERTREIATIRVLGFYKNETDAYVFRENIILTFLGTLLGLPLGFIMHRIIMSKIKVELICFQVHVEPLSYLYSILITLIFSIVVDFVMRGKISSISMSESLKAIE